MASRKSQSGKISVFKGREAKLNHAIFHVLALKGPLTIYNIYKEVRTQRRLRYVRYASANKRVRSLAESGYVRKIGVKRTKAGFKSSIYELTPKAYLAILFNSVNLEALLMRMDETEASVILGNIIYIL